MPAQVEAGRPCPARRDAAHLALPTGFCDTQRVAPQPPNLADAITYLAIGTAGIAGIFLFAFTIYAFVAGFIGLVCLMAGLDRLARR